MTPTTVDNAPRPERVPAESPRKNQKLAAFAFTIRFAHARSTAPRDVSVERSVDEDKAIGVQEAHLKLYLSFSPKAVHRSLFARQATKPGCFPQAEEVFASVLFADISGFTRLSARLGVDHLKAHINAYFGSMIRVIDKYCGDVIKFCGDAVMIVWQTSLSDTEEAKQATALLAAACSLSLLEECGSYDHGKGDQAVSLRLHCGVGVGKLFTYIVGNGARAEYLISGDPLRQIASTETEAGVGEVVVSPQAFAFIKEDFYVEMTPNSNYKLLDHDTNRSRQGSGSSRGPLRSSLSLLAGARRPKGVVPSPEGSPTYSPRSDKVKRPRLSIFGNFNVPPPTADDASSINDNASDSSEYASSLAERVINNFNRGALNSDRPKKKLPDDAICHLPHLAAVNTTHSKPVPMTTIQNLAAFVQEPARAAIQAGAMSYLAEIREVVTVFINIGGLEQCLEKGDIEAMQKVMEVALDALGKYRGALRQFVVDDKGCVMILAFGLPRFTHEDNATRAVETSMLIRDSLIYFDLSCKIGITHGQVYCGLVGSEDRHEYAMMGASVNLAARLMASCLDGEIRVSDDIVQRTAKSGFVFHTLGKIKAKGYSRPVAVFKPCERRKGMGFNMMDDQHPLFGRQNELGLLFRACDKQLEKRTGRVFLVRGPAGVGKTRLLSEVARHAQQQHKMTVVAAAGVPSQKSANYFVVTHLLEIVTGIEKGTGDRTERSGEAQEEYQALLADWIRGHVSIQKLAGHPLSELLSLLNDVVSASFPEHQTVLGLRADERQHLQTELICAILREALESELNLLIVDDLQWVDAQSQLVLSRLIEHDSEILCLMATRAETGDKSGLTTLEGVTDFTLSPLDINECTALVSTIVGERVKAQFAHEISETTLCAIHTRSGGIPAYIKELSSALKEALFTNTFETVEDLTLGVQDVTMQQFDQLRGTEQILLKAASVIGLEFSSEILHYALSKFGAVREAARMEKTLQRLLAAGLVKCLTEGNAPEKLYTFAHFSLKETAYNLMLEEHRQRLHEAIASYYELQGPLDPLYLQMCVHHYLKTNNMEKKQQYLAAAATYAKEQHRYADLLISCSQLIGITCGMDEQQIIYRLVQRQNASTNATQGGRFRPRRRRMLHTFSFSDMFPANRVSPADRPNALQQGITPSWIGSKDVRVFRLSEHMPNEWIGLWLAHVGVAMLSLGKVREGHGRMVVGLKLMGFPVCTSATTAGYWWNRHVTQRCFSRSYRAHEARHLEAALECFQLLCATELARARLLEATVHLEAALAVFAQLTYPLDACSRCRLHAFSGLCLQIQAKHEQSAGEMELARRCCDGSSREGMSHIHVDLLDGIWQANCGNWSSADTAAESALARLDPQQQGSNRSIAMLIRVWANLFQGNLDTAAQVLRELETSFSFAQRGAITRWTLHTLIVYHALHGDQHTAELAIEKLKQATGHRRSNAVRAGLVALVHRQGGNHDSSYKYAKYAMQRYATRIQGSFMGHFLFFCILDSIFYAIVRVDTQLGAPALLRLSGGVEEMKKYLTVGTQAFVKQSASFPAAHNLSKIANARLLYVTGQFQQAATELEQCVLESNNFEAATALLDLLRVRKSQATGSIEDLKDRAAHAIQQLNLTFEARQLQLLVQ